MATPEDDCALTVSTALQLVQQGLALLAAQDPTALPAAQALAGTAALLRVQERMAAVVLRRIAGVDVRQLYALQEAPSTGTWLQAQHVGVDRSQVALARRLQRMPAVAEEVTAGRLALAAAQRVGVALDQVRRHVDRADGQIDGLPEQEVLRAVVVDGVLDGICAGRGGLADDDPELHALRRELTALADAPLSGERRLEAAFLVLARPVEPALLGPALARLVDALLPLELERRAEDAHRDRGLALRRKGGGPGWTVTGELDDECGELLFTVLTAARATDPDNVVDTAGWEGRRVDADLAQCQAPRSRRQQDHDALRLAVRRLLDAGALGLREKVVPHLLVTAGLDALHGAPGALPAQGASGAPLPVGTVRRWLADSALTRMVLGLGRRVLATSHTERTLKPHERRVLRLQWGDRCAGAGCTHPPGSRLVPHHAVPWHLRGTTSLRDSVPLCERTHHDLHTGRRTLRLRDGRCVGPDGWVTPAEEAA